MLAPSPISLYFLSKFDFPLLAHLSVRKNLYDLDRFKDGASFFKDSSGIDLCFMSSYEFESISKNPILIFYKYIALICLKIEVDNLMATLTS